MSKKDTPEKRARRKHYEDLWFNMTPEEQDVYRSERKAKKIKLRKAKAKEENKEPLSVEELKIIHIYNEELGEEREARRKARLLEEAKLFENAPKTLKKLKDNVAVADKLFCMDLEFHTYTRKLTEVGVAIYYPKTDIFESHHFVIKETYDLRNTLKSVPDHKDNFNFGKSKIWMLYEVKYAVANMVKDSDYLVGHAFQNDAGFLRQCGYSGNSPVLDTQRFSKSYFLQKQAMSLLRVTDGLGIETEFLHNAGNDAHYTLKSLLEMAT